MKKGDSHQKGRAFFVMLCLMLAGSFVFAGTYFDSENKKHEQTSEESSALKIAEEVCR